MPNRFHTTPSRTQATFSFAFPISQTHPTPSDGATEMLIDGEEQQEVVTNTPTSTTVLNKTSPQPSIIVQNEGEENESSKKRDLTEYNLDGLNCPICIEPWTFKGDHQVCRYRITILLPFFRRSNLHLIQDRLLKELRYLKKQVHAGNVPFGGTWRNSDQFLASELVHEKKSGFNFARNVGGCGSLHCKFVLEHEKPVGSAHLFDVDAQYEVLLLARRISGMGGIHILNKINLINPSGNEEVQLPLSIKAVKDLHLSPCGRLALLASLGKKLSVFSMGGNNLVITYNLPIFFSGPAWSCSWDINSPHYMYIGLQNGMLLIFDMWYTVHPVQTLEGLNSRPIHTIHSLEHNTALHQSVAQLLTASPAGPCLWNTTRERESTHSLSQLGKGTPSSLVLVKRVASNFYFKLRSASTQLGDVVTTKSAIINVENCPPMFAYGNNVVHGLTLLELPSLAITPNLKPHQHPILDVKYSQSQGSGVLGCISEDKLQLFSAKNL